MKIGKIVLIALIVVSALVACSVLPAVTANEDGGEGVGNCLSYPVIWAEGVTKPLRGSANMTPQLDGDWWYWWGTEGEDPNTVPLSCAPDLLDLANCSDGSEPGEGWVKAYLQKDQQNVWQAGSEDWSGSPVNVTWIDWGDNLESVDWYTKSMVRTEVVLFQDLDNPMLEYEMRHTDGWGITEVHGLAANYSELEDDPIIGNGTRATVYSPCARLTIQKLLVDWDDPLLAGNLTWVPEEGWTESDDYSGELINDSVFNDPVYTGGDGPESYSAEINVKGRIIYGYTWNVKELNDAIINDGTADGYYRITFSFDGTCGSVDQNTFFVDGVTQILLPIEEDEGDEGDEGEVTSLSSESDGGSDTGGAVAVIDFENGLTYIDIHILKKGNPGPPEEPNKYQGDK